MKKMILILILVISCTAITKAQKVFSVEYASQADIKDLLLTMKAGQTYLFIK
jgi:hypothetical protein